MELRRRRVNGKRLYCTTKLCCACSKVAFSDFAAFRYVICVAAVASILC